MLVVALVTENSHRNRLNREVVIMNRIQKSLVGNCLCTMIVTFSVKILNLIFSISAAIIFGCYIADKVKLIPEFNAFIQFK